MIRNFGAVTIKVKNVFVGGGLKKVFFERLNIFFRRKI